MPEQSDKRAKVVASALAARAALEALLLELTQEEQEPSPSSSPLASPPAPAAAASCSHENREDLRTFGVTESWRCRDCGYESRR